MKKLISIILTLVMLLSMTTVIAEEEIKVYVDGEQVVFDAQPFIENDRTLVPMRAIAEKLGAEVAWDAENKTVTVKKELYTDYNLYTILTIGNSSMDYYEEDIERGTGTIKNEKVIELDAPAKIADDRTYIPLRAVSEAFDCVVQWDGDTRTVTIQSHDYAEKHNETYTQRLMSHLPQDENYVISPFSIKTAMMMVANGTEEDVQTEILNAMNIDNIEAFNKSIKETIQRYIDEDISINVANSIWFNKSVAGNENSDFSDDFKSVISEYYNGNAETVTTDNSVECVNEWIEEKTDGEIPNFLSEEEREYLIALVNTICMEDYWETPFNPKETYKEKFTDIDGKKTEIDFMHRTGYFDYYEGENTKILRIPHLDTSIYFVLGDGMVYEKNLFDAILKSTPMSISIPKFEIEYESDFVEVLKKMGVTKAFKSSYDFSSMVQNVPDALHIAKVLQKAVIEVDEEGTKAAAATGVIVTKGLPSVPEDNIVVFKADEPFTYYVCDDTMGEILFAGRYVKCEP